MYAYACVYAYAYNHKEKYVREFLAPELRVELDKA